MNTYWNQMDKTWTHTNGIKWIIKEYKWNHMDNFIKVYGTKWTNDTYIEVQWIIKESIWKHMDNVNKLYGTKWTTYMDAKWTTKESISKHMNNIRKFYGIQ